MIVLKLEFFSKSGFHVKSATCGHKINLPFASFSGQTTKVKINMLIRSMGPISEEDMVCHFKAKSTFTILKENVKQHFKSCTVHQI